MFLKGKSFCILLKGEEVTDDVGGRRSQYLLKGKSFSCLLEGEEVDDDGLLKGEG